MSTAAVFLIVAAGAAVVGSLLVWFAHRVRRPRPPDFQDQLRAIAPLRTGTTPPQPSGIVPIDPGPDEER